MRAWLALLLVACFQEAPDSLRVPESEFARRRSAILERLPDGALAVDAGPLGEVGSDSNTPVFDFKYLTGFHDPEGIFVLTPRKSAVFVSQDRCHPKHLLNEGHHTGLPFRHLNVRAQFLDARPREGNSVPRTEL